MAKLKKEINNEAPELYDEAEEALEKEKKQKDNSPEAKKKRKKKAIIIAFLSMCIIGIISYIVVYCIPEPKPENTNPMMQEALGQYGSNQSYIFYPADDELDITKVEEYQGLDRLLHYTLGPETIAITSEDIASYGDDIKFLYNYFEIVKAGDYTAYNKLFTKEYYKNNPFYIDFTFTPQMIYDINIKKLGESSEGTKTIYNYDVTYKIYRNNGTFRNDIIDNMSKTLYFTIVKDKNSILIDSIQYYIK